MSDQDLEKWLFINARAVNKTMAIKFIVGEIIRRSIFKK